MSIPPCLIPEIQLLQKFDLENPRSRSQSKYNTLSTHIPFVPCRSALSFLGYSYFKIRRSGSLVRSKLKVTTWVQHSVDSYPFRSMSIGHPILELWLFQNLTLKIKGQGHGWSRSSKSECGSNKHPIDSHSFRSMSIGPPIPELQHFKNLTLKIQGQGQMTMMLHNYRSRQFDRTSNGINPSSGFRDMASTKSGPSAASFQVFGPWTSPYGENWQITMTLHNYRYRQGHETLNGVNPSSGFWDMHSAKSAPNLWQIWQVFGPWASPYGANGQMTMTVHNYRPRQIHRTLNGENPSSCYRDMGSASLAATSPAGHPHTHPPARTVTTIPLQPRGLRGNKWIITYP